MSFICDFNGLQNSFTKIWWADTDKKKLYNRILKGTLPYLKETFFWNTYHTYRIHTSVLSAFHLLSFGKAAWLTSFSYPSKKLVLITSLQCIKISHTAILSMEKTADFNTSRTCKRIVIPQTPHHYHFQELCMASWSGFSYTISMAVHALLLSHNDPISCVMILSHRWL